MEGKRNIIIASGGTGGHLYPGLALARELKGRGFEPVFIVREDDAGREILARENFAFREIPIVGMPRRPSLRILKFLFLLVRGLGKTALVLNELRPAAIAGMGGYSSFPVVFMGRLQGIPAVIHEQNCIPGLSNRILAPLVQKVGVSFAESLRFFPAEKTAVTGNPVRRELFEADRKGAYGRLALSPGKFTVLVFGGSQGAARVNRAVVEAFAHLADLKEKIQFLHLTGWRDHEIVRNEYERKGIPGATLPYLHTMGDAYAAADLVISRAGATTVAELDILAAPSILIPLPTATANHQEHNARVLAKAGTGTIILEKDLTAEKLAAAVRERVKAPPAAPPSARLPGVLPQAKLADIVTELARRAQPRAMESPGSRRGRNAQ